MAAPCGRGRRGGSEIVLLSLYCSYVASMAYSMRKIGFFDPTRAATALLHTSRKLAELVISIDQRRFESCAAICCSPTRGTDIFGPALSQHLAQRSQLQ